MKRVKEEEIKPGDVVVIISRVPDIVWKHSQADPQPKHVPLSHMFEHAAVVSANDPMLVINVRPGYTRSNRELTVMVKGAVGYVSSDHVRVLQ